MIHGQFRLWPGTPQELVLKNNVLDAGEASFLKMIARADVADVASGGNWFIGLCGNVFSETDTLATLAGEPAVANGYARKAVTRNAAGWPTLDVISGLQRIATTVQTFTAAGGDFSTSIWRAFLCNVGAGAGGILFSVSGPLPSALLVVNGASFPMQYELFLR